MKLFLLISITLLSRVVNSLNLPRSYSTLGKIVNSRAITGLNYGIGNDVLAPKAMSDRKEKATGWELVKETIDETWGEKSRDPKRKPNPPPIYEPGPYPQRLIAAAAYLIPMVDVADLGKYMFQAYPEIGAIYNTCFGTISSVYNGVPFLPFAVFFIMSYISRAPTFPVEIRFHFAQAFMVALIQVIPSFTFGFLEKAGVPGMGVLSNTVFLWTMVSCTVMQIILLNPLSVSKNPFLINVLGWSMRFMNYTKDMAPKRPK